MWPAHPSALRNHIVNLKRIAHWHVRWQTVATFSTLGKQTAMVDEWIQRDARPVSLRQLTVFGRSLTKARLLESANYVRFELPTRIAHRLRDLQTLPYIVITNPHMSRVYELYLKALTAFSQVPEIKSLEDNNAYCSILHEHLKEHMTVIPRLVMGLLESQNMLQADVTDRLMNTLLKSRISRRVIAEQHIALTEAFSSDRTRADPSGPIGEVFLHCNAKELVERCIAANDRIMRSAYGASIHVPEVVIQGHHNATLTYIPAHLEYIIGELLRNSFQAIIERRDRHPEESPPVEVLICEAPQHVIFRISDRGGGVSQGVLPHLWSFVKGPRKDTRLENLTRVPHLAATLQELQVASGLKPTADIDTRTTNDTSLSTLSGRPPDLRLGIGLPMSRVYAEYWAGSLELHSLEGFGVDAFLQVSKLGNKNEQLSTRASMDAL